MHRKNFTPLFIIVLVIFGALTGYNYFFTPFADREFADQSQGILEEQQPTPAEQLQLAEQAVADEVERQFEQLSPSDLVFQTIAAPLVLDATDSAETAQNDWGEQYGFFTIFGSNLPADRVAATTALLEENQVVQSWFAVDHEGGSVQRLSGVGFTRLPSWEVLCQSISDTERDTLLETSAAELRSVGIDIVFAPMLDVAEQNSVLQDRVCGADQREVARLGLVFSRAFERAGVQTTLKHFPGIGKTTKDTHTNFDSVALEYEDTLAFRAVLDESRKHAVMVAHVGIANQDAYVPCSLSGACISQLTTAYPEVLVVSDALDMSAARYSVQNPSTPKSLEVVSQEAIIAGNHVLVFGRAVTPAEIAAVHAVLLDRYTTDAVFSQKIDAAAKKVLRYKVEHAYDANR